MATYVEKGNHLEFKRSKLIFMDNSYFTIDCSLFFVSLFFVSSDSNFYFISFWVLSQFFFFPKLKEISRKTNDVRRHAVGLEITDSVLSKLSNDYFVFCDVCLPINNNSYHYDYIIIGPSGVFCLEINCFEGNVSISSNTNKTLLQNPSKKIEERKNLIKPLAINQHVLSKTLSKYHANLPVYSCLFFPNPYTDVFSYGGNYYAFDKGEKLLQFLSTTREDGLAKYEVLAIADNVRKNVL